MNENKKKFFKKNAPTSIIGVLLFAVIGSALYDFFVKPGINIFAESIFNLITFGSQTIKDYSFKTAALDPSSIPSLLLLVGIFIFFTPRHHYLDNIIKTHKVGVVIRMLFRLTMAFFIINMYNQSILTWRIFNANITIIAPVTNQIQIQKFKSRFASMKTKAEYDSIYTDMKKIATLKNIKLRDERPW